MILDNLYSNDIRDVEVDIFNNLHLPIQNSFEHDKFVLNILDECDMKNYNSYSLGVYQPSHKKKIVELLNPSIDKFVNIIHNGLDISKTSSIGKGLLINSKVSVAAHSKIGNFVSINRHVSIGHHTIIGDYSSINPGTNIAGNVHVGEGTTIGMGTNILHNVRIGNNSIIGAGSTVTKDIPDNVVAYGSPCVVIRDNV